MLLNIYYSFIIFLMFENVYIFVEIFYNIVYDYKFSCEILID